MDGALDSHPKIIKAGRLGREVFLYLVRCNARLELDGELPLECIEPAVMAHSMMTPVTECDAGIVTAVTAELISVTPQSVLILGWNDEWRGPRSSADRMAKLRANKNSKSKNNARRVTAGDVTSVTGDAGDALEKRREEKKREEKRGRAAEVDMPAGWQPDDTAKALAAELRLSLISEAADFRDWTASKGRRFADWQAGFRSHLRSQAKRNSTLATKPTLVPQYRDYVPEVRK